MAKEVRLTDGSILLRPYRRSDAVTVYEAVRESLAELSLWLPWAHADYSIKESRKWIEYCADTWAKGIEYNFAITDDGSGYYLGGCGLNQVNLAARFANLGYWVRSSRTGEGIATAASVLVLRFGFDELGLNRIEIGAASSNKASLRVAEKLEAAREEIESSRIVFRDKVYDRVRFSLTPADLEKKL